MRRICAVFSALFASGALRIGRSVVAIASAGCGDASKGKVALSRLQLGEARSRTTAISLASCEESGRRLTKFIPDRTAKESEDHYAPVALCRTRGIPVRTKIYNCVCAGIMATFPLLTHT